MFKTHSLAPLKLTQMHCLHLTFSICHWIPPPLKVTGNHLFSLQAFNILFLASPLHPCVSSLFYSVTLLSTVYHNFLCCSSAPGETLHQPQTWGIGKEASDWFRAQTGLGVCEKATSLWQFLPWAPLYMDLQLLVLTRFRTHHAALPHSPSPSGSALEAPWGFFGCSLLCKE